MALTLYLHPLASYCWKVLVALYENETPFEARLIDLANPAEREELARLWPIAKFPVLRDSAGTRVWPESTIIIEYVATRYPGKAELLPADPDLALEVRLQDRFLDIFVHEAMQRIVADRLRPQDQKDSLGVEQAHQQLAKAYGMLEELLQTRAFMAGESFTLADCAAAPALYYGNLVHPFGSEHAHVAAYLERLTKRPSFARVLTEAEPYFSMFPR